MSQVSYGTITITDTTDKNVFIRYAKQVPLQSVSDFQLAPDTDTRYIAVLNIPSSEEEPPWDSKLWQWSEFIGTDGVSVTGVTDIYYLKVNIAPSKRTDGTDLPAAVNTIDTWSLQVPTYVTNGEYWVSTATSLSSGTIVYSEPIQDLGLTSSNSNASNALTQATAAKTATDLMGGHFIYGGVLSQQTPAGARVVETIENSSGEDVSKKPAQWKHNVLIGSNGILLRYNELNLAGLTTDGIRLYGTPFQNSSDNSYIQNNELISLTREGLQINRPSALNNQNEVVPGSKAVAVTQNGFSVYNNEGAQVAQYGNTILLGKIVNNTVQDGIQISDAELGFYSKGQKTAYVNKQKLYIPYSVVLNEMIVGTKEEYRLTNDSSVQTDKDYYIKNDKVYEKVANPSGNPQEHGWYELIENSLWAWKVTDEHLRLVWNGGDVEGV